MKRYCKQGEIKRSISKKANNKLKFTILTGNLLYQTKQEKLFDFGLSLIYF